MTGHESGIVIPMELADEFRARAQRCLKFSQEAPAMEAQAHWISMAQLWLNLAHFAEDQDAEFLSKEAAHDEIARVTRELKG